ncbi:uncharacterized protein B0T15DRAFT_504464 [Chaetomium strumarium]|uniref:CR-type domain-containing protein n=1 Tax=Chaetomium strumarium TaxID=1170767 RepID=A0AAJ0GNJ6_9PEZI|nr:hypothetical protein B0T15DRAFT_504464 [Chaetomium strumarium]
MPRPTPCGGCRGKGYDTVQCGRCHGTGRDGTTTFQAMCDAGCAGRGKDRRGAKCGGCNGTGKKTYTQPKKCNPCQGTGTGSEVCRYCGGTGLRQRRGVELPTWFCRFAQRCVAEGSAGF